MNIILYNLVPGCQDNIPIRMRRGELWTVPATIDDPAILDEIGEVMKRKGVGGRRARWESVS